MIEHKKGDKFKHNTLNTTITIIRPLGNDCWWVLGGMGEFKIRGYLIQANYKKELDNGTGTDKGNGVDQQELPRHDDHSVRRKR